MLPSLHALEIELVRPRPGALKMLVSASVASVRAGLWSGIRTDGQRFPARPTSLATVFMLRTVPTPVGSLSFERPIPLGK